LCEAAGILDPQFLDVLKDDVECVHALWRVAKPIFVEMYDLTEAEWPAKQAKLAVQLAKFQAKGGNLVNMSQPGAWINFEGQSTLDWWRTWGKEVSELQVLAMLLVPLLAGSGPAERTWKDIGHIITKERGRLSHGKMLQILFVRKWLRRKYNAVSEEESNAFKAWEKVLLKKAARLPEDEEKKGDDLVFIDEIEPDWEQNAINGRGRGPKLKLSAVKKDAEARFRLVSCS